MEWVETTGKSVEEARDLALDQLGVAEDDAEIEVVEEPKAGLFGRLRGEARVRARVRPTAVRPKQDRRGRGRKGKPEGDEAAAPDADRPDADSATERTERSDRPRADRSRNRPQQRKERSVGDSQDQRDDGPPAEPVDPQAVGEVAVEFMTGLTAAFGTPAAASLKVDGSELDVQVDGNELGLLIGPAGRTLMAIQDLARVASQRKLGDHDTRLRIDVGGYRERRRVALEKFATTVASDVLESGRGKALEPMASADRKVVHDTIQAIEGVSSHSDGEEPRRRVVITPA
jgi:spoIIIJ-associated protein